MIFQVNFIVFSFFAHLERVRVIQEKLEEFIKSLNSEKP